MKNLIILVLFLTSYQSFAQKATDNFAGKWKTEEGQIIEVKKLGTVFSGTATNNDKKVVILESLQFRDGKWKGTLSNPKKKITADCEMILENTNKIRIIAKKGMMGKTIYWTKAD